MVTGGRGAGGENTPGLSRRQLLRAGGLGAFGLYLAQWTRSRTITMVLAAWLWLGLLAAYSRGPWLV